MNIRRFVATDMREALNAIRADLGADAVMLSSRKLPNGVEVIAAIDYDDSLLGLTSERGAPAARVAEPAAVAAPAPRLTPVPPPAPAPRAAAPVAPAFVAPAPAAAAPTPVPKADFAASFRAAELAAHDDDAAADDDDLDADDATADESYRAVSDYERVATQFAAMRATRVPFEMPAPREPDVAAAREGALVSDEIKDLRRLLETQLASLAWNDLNREAPVRARMLRELTKLGVDAALATQLAAEIPADYGAQEALRALVKLFGERLPLMQWDMAERGGTFAVVGPTGVGKTTTIAKIAARFVLRHSVDELGLVSTDTYRIGARQQLFNFARILRAPFEVAESSHDLKRILDGFERKKLVLIDTAGMSQRDVRLANQFNTLKVEDHRVQTVLALSAGADRGCLSEALRVFQTATPEALIITKLDEAAALGGVLSLAIRSGLPIAYLSDGQRVPEDLHLASPKRFWLMHNAIKLTQSSELKPDENELAEHFGQMELAANA